MERAVYRTVSIPEFPFFNRESERREIHSFLCGPALQARVLLLEGEGGIGKSRLLSECLNALDEDTVVVMLNARDGTGRQRSLVQSVAHESKRLRALLMKSHRTKTLQLELERIGHAAKRVVPAAGTLVPVFGEVTRSALEAVLESRDAGAAHWIDHLLTISELLATLSPVVLVIDDFHRLTPDEQQLASMLVSGLTTIQNPALRALISTRPLGSQSTEATAAFRLSAKNGELIRLPLDPLSKAEIRELVSAILFNPGSSEPLVDLADGSPQRLLELMIKLNFNGDLERRNDLIVLPVDLRVRTYLLDDIWTEIEASKILYATAATLAIGTGVLALADVGALAYALGYTGTEVLNAATTLENLGIFTLDETPSGGSIRFSHDTLQEQIAERVRKSSRISFAYYNAICARFIEDLIAKVSASNDQDMQDLLSLKVARAHCLRDCAAHGWEDVSQLVAEECLAASRFLTAAALAKPLVESLRQTRAPGSLELAAAAAAQIKGCYAVGDYASITSLPEPLAPSEPYAVYATIMATIIEKKEGWFEKAEAQFERVTGDAGMTAWRPLFESARAIAMRERGDVEGGEALLDAVLQRGGAGFDSFVWHQFLAIASIFRAEGRGFDMARTALEYFTRRDDPRMAGIAATNLSIVMVCRGDFESALVESARAEDFLKRAGSADVIFPLLNRVAIHLSTGHSQEALALARSLLFREIPSERRLDVLNDLALAQWASGVPFDMEEIRNEATRNRNSWMSWISAFNLAFLQLDGGRAPASRALLSSLRADLQAADPDHRSAPFWNGLLLRCGRPEWTELKLERKGKPSALERVASPERNVGRPIFLSFGRI